MTDNVKNVFDKIYKKYVCDNADIDLELAFMTEYERNLLVDKLFKNWFDIRKTIDEQMIVNAKFSPNYFFYEAKEAEARAKFLYVKAFVMMNVKNT